MKKIFIILIVLAIVAVVIYFLAPSKEKKVKPPTEQENNSTKLNAANTTTVEQPFTPHKVITKYNPLNIRQLPSLESKILGTVAKGATVWAKPLSIAPNWHAYSLDKKTINGYLSSQYLQKI